MVDFDRLADSYVALVTAQDDASMRLATERLNHEWSQQPPESSRKRAWVRRANQLEHVCGVLAARLAAQEGAPNVQR